MVHCSTTVTHLCTVCSYFSGVSPSCLRVRGGVLPGHVSSLTQRQTAIHTYSQFRIKDVPIQLFPFRIQASARVKVILTVRLKVNGTLQNLENEIRPKNAAKNINSLSW